MGPMPGPRKERARSWLTAPPGSLATEFGGASNGPERRRLGSEREPHPRIPAHGSGGPFLPCLPPATIRTPAATPGGAFAQRPLGQQPRVPPLAAGARGKKEASRGARIWRRRSLTTDARSDRSANSREVRDAVAVVALATRRRELKGPLLS